MQRLSGYNQTKRATRWKSSRLRVVFVERRNVFCEQAEMPPPTTPPEQTAVSPSTRWPSPCSFQTGWVDYGGFQWGGRPARTRSYLQPLSAHQSSCRGPAATIPPRRRLMNASVPSGRDVPLICLCLSAITHLVSESIGVALASDRAYKWISLLASCACRSEVSHD